MGPSGFGKTTLLSIACALLKPKRGGVRVCNTDITWMGEGDLASIRREKVAFVYRSFNLPEALMAPETNKAVVIVSHDHHLRDIADRVVQSEDGRLHAES